MPPPATFISFLICQRRTRLQRAFLFQITGSGTSLGLFSFFRLVSVKTFTSLTSFPKFFPRPASGILSLTFGLCPPVPPIFSRSSSLPLDLRPPPLSGEGHFLWLKYDFFTGVPPHPSDSLSLGVGASSGWLGPDHDSTLLPSCDAITPSTPPHSFADLISTTCRS